MMTPSYAVLRFHSPAASPSGRASAVDSIREERAFTRIRREVEGTAIGDVSMVTVLDGHPHTLSFVATINRVDHVALGVGSFGQSGDIDDVYRYHRIDTDSIVRAALDAIRE